MKLMLAKWRLSHRGIDESANLGPTQTQGNGPRDPGKNGLLRLSSHPHAGCSLHLQLRRGFGTLDAFGVCALDTCKG